MAVKNHENSVHLQQVEGHAAFSRYVKGVVYQLLIKAIQNGYIS